jgi:hypothetical protein
MRWRYLGFCIAVLIFTGCRKEAEAPPLRGVRNYDAGTADAGGTYYVTGEPRPSDGFPPDPVFSCCESNFVVKPRQRPPRASNPEYTKADGNKASELNVALKLAVEFDCDVLDGQTCRGTFSAVKVTRHPQLQVGGAATDPASHRVFWNEAVAPCDGTERKSQLTVLYVARYAGRGVPAGGPQNLVLKLEAPRAADGTKKGTDYELTIALSQLNLDRPLDAKIEKLEAQ